MTVPAPLELVFDGFVHAFVDTVDPVDHWAIYVRPNRLHLFDYVYKGPGKNLYRV